MNTPETIATRDDVHQKALSNTLLSPKLYSTDYAAMVVLAQVDPRADYSDQPTVLNLFGDPQNVTGLTDWDRAYLQALYEAEPDRASAAAQEAAVAERLQKGRRAAANQQDAQSD